MRRTWRLQKRPFRSAVQKVLSPVAPPIPKESFRRFTRPQPTNMTLRTKAPKAQGARDFVYPLPINCEMRGEPSEGEYQMARSVYFVAGRHERVDVRRRRQPAIQAVVARNLRPGILLKRRRQCATLKR